MQRNCSAYAWGSGHVAAVRSMRSAGLAAALLFSAGCSVSPLAKHTVAFNAATRIVIDSSEDAYVAANRLHREVMVDKAVTDYDKNPQWSPYTDVKPLLTTEQLDARIKVLDALKAYSETLVDLTHPKKNEALNAAAAGAGSNVQALAGTLAKNFGGSAMSDTTANVVSTAVDALGLFLIDRTTRRGLNQVTATMDPNITALCELLNSDITVLRRQADVDFQRLITDDDLEIRKANVDPFTHREQVGRLIEMAAQQEGNDELLKKLQTALHTLEVTHQALASAAQGKDPETIKEKITELSAAGQNLATFYKSLSSTSTTTATSGD